DLVQAERLEAPARHRERGLGHDALAPVGRAVPVAELCAIDAPRAQLPRDAVEADAADRLAALRYRPRHGGFLRERSVAALDERDGLAAIHVHGPAHLLGKLGV